MSSTKWRNLEEFVESIEESRVLQRISGGRRVVMESTRRTSTWTKSLNERYVEMRREGEARFGNDGARVRSAPHSVPSTNTIALFNTLNDALVADRDEDEKREGEDVPF